MSWLDLTINPDALRRAIDLGVIDQSAESAARAVEHADLAMIATPVGSMQNVLHAIAPHLARTAIVTDVGSTKASVIAAARHALGSAFERFVPGHPIAGREHSGVEYSEAALFNDKLFICTPVDQTDAEAVRQVEALWRSVGCHTDRMTPEEHDTVFAAVSTCRICWHLHWLRRSRPTQTPHENSRWPVRVFAISRASPRPVPPCGAMYALQIATHSPMNSDNIATFSQNCSRRSMNAIAKHCKASSREQVRACVRLGSAH